MPIKRARTRSSPLPLLLSFPPSSLSFSESPLDSDQGRLALLRVSPLANASESPRRALRADQPLHQSQYQPHQIQHQIQLQNPTTIADLVLANFISTRSQSNPLQPPVLPLATDSRCPLCGNSCRIGLPTASITTSFPFLDASYFQLLESSLASLTSLASASASFTSPAVSVLAGDHALPFPSSSHQSQSQNQDKSRSRNQKQKHKQNPKQNQNQNNSQDARARTRTQSHSPHATAYFETFFYPLTTLGRGATSQVMLATHHISTHNLGHFAIKIIPYSTQSYLSKALKEITLFTSLDLDHPNLIKFRHVWSQPYQYYKVGLGPDQVDCLFVLMDWCRGGNLEKWMMDRGQSSESVFIRNGGKLDRKEILRRRRMKSNLSTESEPRPLHTLSDAQILHIFAQILAGLEYLHSRQIAHCDIKSSNILLQDESDFPCVVIGDLGNAQIRGEEHGEMGTVEWMPVECFLNPSLTGDLNDDEEDEQFEVDLWSLGLLLYYLHYGVLPYSQVDDIDQLISEIKRFDRVRLDHSVAPEFKEILAGLLQRDKHARWSLRRVRESVEALRLRLGGEDGIESELDLGMESSEIERRRSDSGVEGAAFEPRIRQLTSQRDNEDAVMMTNQEVGQRIVFPEFLVTIPDNFQVPLQDYWKPGALLAAAIILVSWLVAHTSPQFVLGSLVSFFLGVILNHFAKQLMEFVV